MKDVEQRDKPKSTVEDWELELQSCFTDILSSACISVVSRARVIFYFTCLERFYSIEIKGAHSFN